MAEIFFPKPHPLSPTSRRRAFRGEDGRYYINKGGVPRLAKGVETTESLYYWWFQYLRRSDFFQKLCGQDVKLSEEREADYPEWLEAHGRRLHTDFGNVFASDFWTWWREPVEGGETRGVRLFGIKPITQLADFASVEDVLAIRDEIDGGAYKLVAIPTNLTKTTINKRLAKLIKELDVDPTGEQRARYHPKQLKVDTESLRFALDAYDMRLAGKSNIEIGGYYLCTESEMRALIRDGRTQGKSYETEALKKKLGSMGVKEYDEMIESGRDEFAYLSAGKARTVKKNYLNVKASRLIKKAKDNIRAVEQGEFPVGH